MVAVGDGGQLGISQGSDIFISRLILHYKAKKEPSGGKHCLEKTNSERLNSGAQRSGLQGLFGPH